MIFFLKKLVGKRDAQSPSPELERAHDIVARTDSLFEKYRSRAMVDVLADRPVKKANGYPR